MFGCAPADLITVLFVLFVAVASKTSFDVYTAAFRVFHTAK